MPGTRSRSRSRSRSGTRRRLGARRSPLGMRRSYRNSRADKSASKWAKRGIGHIPNSRSRKSWAQKAIKDLWREHKSKKARKHRALLATHKGKFASLPQELQGKIYSMSKKRRSRGGYRCGCKTRTKKRRSRGRK